MRRSANTGGGATENGRRTCFLFLGLMLSLVAGLQGCSGRTAEANRLAELLGVRPGMVVADIGAGNGGMTVIMARRVGPKGHVFSTDIDPHVLVEIRKAIKAARLDNVTVIKATASDTGLPARCCDAIFMDRVYHHLTDPADTDRSLYRALRSGGKIAILDFRPTILLWLWRPKGLPSNREGHGISPVTVSGEMTHAGFQYLRSVDPWPGSWFISTYCLLFEKPPQAAASMTPGIAVKRVAHRGACGGADAAAWNCREKVTG